MRRPDELKSDEEWLAGMNADDQNRVHFLTKNGKDQAEAIRITARRSELESWDEHDEISQRELNEKNNYFDSMHNPYDPNVKY